MSQLIHRLHLHQLTSGSLTQIHIRFNSSRFRNHLNSIISSQFYSSQAFNSHSHSELHDQHQSQPSTSKLQSSTAPSLTPRTTSTSSSIVSFETLSRLHEQRIPITMLTAHDFASARLLAMSSLQTDAINPHLPPVGIDLCLCGDSLAMVSLGYTSTTELSLEEYTYHLRSVRRGLDSTLHPPPGWKSEERPYIYRLPMLVADLPFGTYEGSPERGLRTALNLLAAARIDAVKIEGGPELAPLVRTLTDYGIPVIAHVGLHPQRTAGQGGMRVKGSREASDARSIIKSALVLEEAGAVGVVLEVVPDRLAAALRDRLRVFVIGIGAGGEVDGQVLVTSDLLGSLDSIKPRFVPIPSSPSLVESDRNLTWNTQTQVIRQYVRETRARQFPDPNGTHSYKMERKVFAELESKGWVLD